MISMIQIQYMIYKNITIINRLFGYALFQKEKYWLVLKANFLMVQNIMHIIMFILIPYIKLFNQENRIR